MLKNPNYKYGSKDFSVPISLNFGEFILGTVLKFKNRTAFIDAITHETVTYNEIAQNAINLAVSLTRLGVRKGDAIAVCSENRREYWPTVIGAMCSGAIVTPINTLYTKDELLYNDLVKDNVKQEDFIPADVEGQNDPVILLFSSGTTGLPKGVLITHYNALVSTNILKKPHMEDVGMVFLTAAPWYHSMGLWGTFSSFIIGATMVYVSKFEEKLYLETIQRYKPMIAAVVPPILVMLSKSQILDQYDVSSIVLMVCGAAPVDLETISDVKKRFPNLVTILQGYGMTETTLAISMDSEDSPAGNKPGSVGPVTPGAVVKVVDLKTRKAVGPNKIGEICAKGPMIMKGYVGKDKKEDFDEEGFLKTGDIGYYDDDGYFYIVDRLKELIKYKGYQVPPAEIEAELLQHPAVRDAGVIGVPSKEAGEVPLAFIVRRPGHNVTEDEIKAFIASKLSNPKHLRGGVRFIEEIPKNPTGKILRRELKKMANKSKL